MITRSSLCIYMRFNETSPLHILILAQFFFHLKEIILWHKNFSTTVLYSICNLAAICMIITHWNQLLWQHGFDTGDSINHWIRFSSHEQKSGHVVFSFDENRSTKLKGVPFAQNMHTPFGNLNSALDSGGFHPGGNIDSCQKKIPWIMYCTYIIIREFLLLHKYMYIYHLPKYRNRVLWYQWLQQWHRQNWGQP